MECRSPLWVGAGACTDPAFSRLDYLSTKKNQIPFYQLWTEQTRAWDTKRLVLTAIIGPKSTKQNQGNK